MSTPSLDERPHAEAISAAIKAHLGPHNVYGYGEVPGLDGNPGTVPPIYVLLQVSRRHVPTTRSVRRASRAGWRTSLRAVGRTDDECRWAMNKVSLALDSQRLVVGGRVTSPIQHETSDEPDPDSGRHSALVRFTYTT